MEIEMSRQRGSSVTVEHIAGDSHVIVSCGGHNEHNLAEDWTGSYERK